MARPQGYRRLTGPEHVLAKAVLRPDRRLITQKPSQPPGSIDDYGTYGPPYRGPRVRVNLAQHKRLATYVYTLVKLLSSNNRHDGLK